MGRLQRITQKDDSGRWIIPPERGQAAAERLAAFESACDRLIVRQGEIAARMEALKAQGKQKTAQFRELFAEKLTIRNTLTLWETYGIQ